MTRRLEIDRHASRIVRLTGRRAVTTPNGLEDAIGRTACAIPGVIEMTVADNFSEGKWIWWAFGKTVCFARTTALTLSAADHSASKAQDPLSFGSSIG